jgi:hypothetical protein
MTRLNFSLQLEHASGIDLPVEVRRRNLTLVTRTTTWHGAEVEPGTYHVIARLPAGQEIATSVEAQGPYVSVPLKPDADDASPRETDSQRHYLVSAVSTPAHPRVTAPPTRVTLRYFRGTPVLGHLADLASEELVIDEHTEQSFSPDGSQSGTIWVEFQQPERGPRTTAIPVTTGQPCTLRFVRKPEGYWWLDVHLYDVRADLLCRYRDRGWASEAATVAEQLLEAKLGDPIAAAVGAYGILRLQDLDRLHDWTENLRSWFPWLPDGAVVRGEHLARNGDHAAALGAFVELAERGMPLFSDGLGYATTRLESYVAAQNPLLDSALVTRADRLLSALRGVAGTVDFNHPILAFTADAGRATAAAGP